MELRHLRSFVMVADEAHFTRAAQRLGVAQPALSQQVRRLEAEVGMPLIERTTRKVELTDAGRLFLEHARRVIVEADHAVAVVRDLRELRVGRLSIGASQTMASVDLSDALARYHRRYSSVELVVQEGMSLELAGALRRDQLDLAFVTVSSDGDRLESHPVATEPLVCIVAPGHRLAGRSSIELRDLDGEPFIAFRRGSSIRQTVQRAAREQGFDPRVLCETNEVARTRALVARGLGVAVLPKSDALRGRSAAVAVPLAGEPLLHTVYLSWRENRRPTPAARAFIDMVIGTPAGQRAPGPPR